MLVLHLRGDLGGGDGGEETTAVVTREDASLVAIERNFPPETRVAVLLDAEAGSSSPNNPPRDALAWMLFEDAYDGYDWAGLARDPPNVDAEFAFVQRLAVSTFYIAMGGDDWANNTNWMTGEDVCDWHGIECHYGSSSSSSSSSDVVRRDAIRSLALPDNRLRGSLPAEVTALAHLENLEVFRNEIEGAIPPHLYRMTTLRTLFLDENSISGTISTEIGNLVNLEKFTLNRNEIVGEIPTEIGALVNLTM